jgi:uroporphyrinogen-III synthase
MSPRVLLTRAAGKNAAVAAALPGCEVIEVPLIALESVDSPLPDPPDGAWVIFTSGRAVAEARDRGWLARLALCRVAAVGPATARALTAAGRPPDLVPADTHAAGLLAALDALGEPLAGRPVLYPCAERTQGDLEAGLAARGAQLNRLVLYRNICPPGAAAALAAAWPVDVIALASGSAARNLIAAAGALDLSAAAVVAIGPSTAATCAALGLTVRAVADPHTAEGLAAAVLRCLPGPPG